MSRTVRSEQAPVYPAFLRITSETLNNLDPEYSAHISRSEEPSALGWLEIRNQVRINGIFILAAWEAKPDLFNVKNTPTVRS